MALGRVEVLYGHESLLSYRKRRIYRVVCHWCAAGTRQAGDDTRYGASAAEFTQGRHLCGGRLWQQGDAAEGVTGADAVINLSYANVLDSAKLHAGSGWKIRIPFRDGIRRMWHWFVENQDVWKELNVGRR